MRSCVLSRLAAGTLAAAVIGLIPAGINAQTVVLKNKDGLFEFEGRLVGVEDGLYRLDTSVGPITVPVDQVDCIGPACPGGQATPLPAPTANLAIANTAITVDSQSAFALAEAAADVAGLSLAEAGRRGGVELARIDRDSAADAVFATNLLTDTRLNQQNREVVAYDALIVVTAPDVTVQEMSTDNLAAILSGDVTRWSQLGGQDIPITIFVREDGSDERRLIDDTVLAPRGMSLADRVFKVDNNAGIANAMAAFPGAIGITKYRYRAQQRVMKLTDACGIPRIPDTFSINSGSYLMTEAVHVPANGAGQGGEAEALLAALSGVQGPGLIEAAGFVYPEVISSPGAERSALFQRVISLAQNEPEASPIRASAVNFIEELFSAERLSSTFRFSGNRLDAFGSAELDRLVDYLANAGLADREILFVGFAGGPEDLPLSLGQSRALAAGVLRRFLDRAPELNLRRDLGFATLGFGGVAPVGCGAFGGGDLLNTRVEVWIRPLG